MPEDLHCRLCGLSQVSFAGNRLDRVPPTLTRLHRTLTVLDMGRNRIADLPDDIGQLRALTILDLRQNMLCELPESIGIRLDFT